MAFDATQWIIKPDMLTFYSTMLEGPSGTGKTYQLRTLVEQGYKVLLVAAEKKAASIADLKPDMWPVVNFDYPRSPGEAATSPSDLWKVIQYIRGGAHPYDVVYFDSAMRYSEELLEYLKRVKNMSGQELWGMFAEKLEKALKMLALLTDPTLPKPVHLVATWGVELDKDWTGSRSIQPLVDGQKVKPKINYWFDNVLYLDKLDSIDGSSEFVAYTTGKQGFAAKISSGLVKFDQIIRNPSLGVILRKLEEGGRSNATQEAGQAEARR